MPPPEPCRDKMHCVKLLGQPSGIPSDQWQECPRHGARLRPPGGRVPGPCCRSERLHRTRLPSHEGRRIGLSGTRGSPTVSQFVHQSPKVAPVRFSCHFSAAPWRLGSTRHCPWTFNSAAHGLSPRLGNLWPQREDGNDSSLARSVSAYKDAHRTIRIASLLRLPAVSVSLGHSCPPADRAPRPKSYRIPNVQGQPTDFHTVSSPVHCGHPIPPCPAARNPASPLKPRSPEGPVMDLSLIHI